MYKGVISESDKNKVAIVVVGYNRLSPIIRLLSSLLQARYESVSVPLFISIDCSNNSELYDYVIKFQWPFGNKYVDIQEKRLGLKNHIIQCGDLTQLFKAVILLEDDIFVGEYFYEYTLKVIESYENDDRIGGFALYSHEIGGGIGVPIAYYQDGSSSFLRQDVITWGECWTKVQWTRFKEWYHVFNDTDFERIDMPAAAKKWKSSWAKYFEAFLVDTNRYFVCPYVSNTTCFCDPGEHCNFLNLSGQVCLMSGPLEYKFLSFDDMVRYDVYWVNESIYGWLGLDKKDVCVDWYNLIEKKNKCKYLISTLKMPYKVMRTYGLYLRPIELNVKYNIEGVGIYVYDTTSGPSSMVNVTYSFPFANYCVRYINNSLLVRYYMSYLLNRIKKYFISKLSILTSCV